MSGYFLILCLCTTNVRFFVFFTVLTLMFDVNYCDIDVNLNFITLRFAIECDIKHLQYHTFGLLLLDASHGSPTTAVIVKTLEPVAGDKNSWFFGFRSVTLLRETKH